MYQSLPKRIALQLIETKAWHGELLVSVQSAADQPAPGLAGPDAGEITFLKPGEVVVSAGPAAKINAEAIRRAGAGLVRWMDRHEVKDLAVDLQTLDKFEVKGSFEAFVEGLELGAFQFDRYKSKKSSLHSARIDLLTPAITPHLSAELTQTVELTDCVNLAREWGHLPANQIDPVTLGELASQVAEESGLKCKVLDVAELQGLGAGALLAVGQGSRTGSRLILLEYPGVAAQDNRPIVLVGKSITFDTGGYSLKPVDGIQTMKYDKCGGLAVLATLRAAAALHIKTHLVGILTAAENMVSADAYRPDDIITSLSGKTIEIVSTDAEGRLVLADALTYAQQKFNPRVIIDLATLTGGIVTALGHVRAGVMANNDALAEALLQAGEQTHERLWRMPLDDDYLEPTKGEEADLKNSGGREGAPIFGGIFLKQFVTDEIPWAHIDIAGTADSPKELPYSPKGATGFGVRLLIEYLQRLEK
jgi:leucyl aminopeptidase